MLALPAAARAADVTVVVHGVRNTAGNVLVALCGRQDFLKPDCAYHGMAPARPGDVAVIIRGVMPGDYAAQAFHDEDGNFRLERSFFGLPREGMGFSRDAPMHYGPPRFADAVFAVRDAGVTIGLSLRYF